MITIERVKARILDIPTIRPHKLAFGSINRQSPVIVQVWLSDGATGFGEAATIGGPSWNEESPESIYQIINQHLAPCLIGQSAERISTVIDRMDIACRGNLFAKSAVEMALIDALSRSMGVPAWQLFGGRRIESMELAWTLASGDISKDIDEAHRMLEARRHRLFKIKIGARSPGDDVAHVSAIARAIDGHARLTVDVNQAWDGNTAKRWLPALIASGVDLIEQPVAKWNIEALTDLTAFLDGALVMADETICTIYDAMMLARKKSCHVFSLKVAKHGGMLRTSQVAAIAEAADIGWYAGTMLETSIGSAASAQVFSTLGSKHHGCELFGPQLLVDDIVENRMAIHEFKLIFPDGPGLGITVNEGQLDRFDRSRQGLQSIHVDFAARS